MSSHTTAPMPTAAPRKVVKARRAAWLPVLTASREAQRVATVILEVLGGVRTPEEAAGALGIATPRYYLWEQRAVVGLVTACEPREAARGPRPQSQIAALQKEVLRLKQECARQQALVRAAQRTIGLTPPVPKTAAKAGDKGVKPGAASGKKARKRRPAVRALKAVTALRAATEATEADSSSGPTPEVLQQMAVSPPAPAAHDAVTAASG